MAKITPITEQFQHFLQEMKESFWGDLYDRHQAGLESSFSRRSRSDCGICTVAGERTSAVRRRRATTTTATYERDFVARFGTLRCALPGSPGRGTFCLPRGVCPVHAPDRAPEAGKLYWDAKWPSDGYPLQSADGQGFSVSFIPGRLTDHHLLDDKYIYRLRMMSSVSSPQQWKLDAGAKLAGYVFLVPACRPSDRLGGGGRTMVGKPHH